MKWWSVCSEIVRILPNSYIGYDKWLQEEMALPILVVREYDSSMIQYVQIIQLKKRKK